MKPTTTEIRQQAMYITTLDQFGAIAEFGATVKRLASDMGISETRANDAVAYAARRLRHAQLAEEGAKDYITFRIRLSRSQHERAVMLAKQETGGNVSALFRQRTLG